MRCMKTALVSMNYQGLTVSFNEDGWFNATAAAARFGKQPVLYCVFFAHGLMKVGATTDIARRFEELSTHGVLKPLFSQVLIEKCGCHDLFEAERLAIAEMSSISQRVDKEVFKSISVETVKQVLTRAIKNSSLVYPDDKSNHIEEIDCHEMALKTGLYGSLVYVAKSYIIEFAEKEAINFVLSNTPEIGEIDQEKWENSFGDLHPFSWDLIPVLAVKNATLIVHGVAYPDRKKILESLVIETRVLPFPSRSA